MLGEAWGQSACSYRWSRIGPCLFLHKQKQSQLLCFYFLLAVEITVNRTMWHLELDSPAPFSALASPLS